MRRVTWALAAFLVLIPLASAMASELQTYVQQCQSELHFNASDVPALNCNTGPQFALGGRTPVNDFIVYRQINADVDLVAACRWGDDNGAPFANTKFASLELIIHNRTNGSTCFFAAKDSGNDPDKPVPSAIVSPTNFSNVHPNADDYWLQPTALNNKLLLSDTSPGATDYMRCVGCHVSGPYIASEDIAPFLARFGLLNNGHDTVADMTANGHYHAVGSNAYNNPTVGTNAFKAWDSIIYNNMYDDDHNGKPDSDCSSACHSVGRKSTVGNLFPLNDTIRVRLLPSIQSDISYLQASGLMPPYDESSHYRWINRDNPVGDGVDIETFTASKSNFPVLQSCGVPTVLEAHAVGSDVNFSTAEMSLIPDKLRSFNLRDGLTCLNSDQGSGNKCSDYAVSYECSDGTWTPFYNKDKVASDDGDHEERIKAIVQATAFCGSAPVGIQTQVLTAGGTLAQVKGPNDKLQQFAPSGLICNNADQSGGHQCSSYVVRYRECRPSSEAYLAKVKNAWTNPPTFTDRYLTTTNNVNDADTRAQANNYQYPSQDWIIEAVAGGNTIRLKDVWSGKYLTASSNNDLATVLVHDSDTSLMRQQWIIETIANSAEVRFRNVGSGRYLTVGNYTSDPYYAPIYSQSLSSQNWASQRWVLQ